MLELSNRYNFWEIRGVPLHQYHTLWQSLVGKKSALKFNQIPVLLFDLISAAFFTDQSM
jgi:hypothetical protein